MITKAKKGESIAVIDDIWMSPTYTKDAALALKEIIESKLPYGTYHVTNSGCCSWYQFAEKIFQITGLNPVLTPIKSKEVSMKAKRPLFSALRSTRLPLYGIEMREWKEALCAYLIEKGHIRRGS
jgi:dTDP-4-dehydrorhamnose reductase